MAFLQSKDAPATVSNAKDHSGVPAIVFAASRGHHNIVKLLVNNQANVNVPEDHSKRTALMRACQGGFVKVSTRIDHFHGRKNNANPEFFFAFSIGPSQTIECLLKHGADPAKTDLCGRTAAHWAAIGGQVEAVRVLFSNHANKVNDPDDSGYSCLLHACEHGYGEVVTFLLSIEGINPLIENAIGYTATGLAKWYGHKDIFRHVLDKSGGAQKDVNSSNLTADIGTAVG